MPLVLQDISSAESVEIEFIDESEEPLEINKPSPTDVFSSYHEYDLFLLNQEIYTPSDNLNSQNTHVCENLDDILIHATNLSHTFAQPQLMAEHNCDELDPTDDPSKVPTAFQASSNHTSNPKCAHDPMATQCNQSQYISLMKPICAHNPSASQVSQTNLSNYLVSPYPPDPGEHVLTSSATATDEQDFPVKWFKFIHPSPKPKMTETPVQKSVHVAYSPISSMNYQWTINLHDGYPLLQGMQPEVLKNLCSQLG